MNGPAGSVPRVSVTDTFVSQVGNESLEMRETLLGYSSSPAMSAMLAVLKLYYVRKDTYIDAMLALQQAQVGQRKHRARECASTARLLWMHKLKSKTITPLCKPAATKSRTQLGSAMRHKPA